MNPGDLYDAPCWFWRMSCNAPMPYYTGEAHEEIETSFAATFGFEGCPAAPLSQPDLPYAENE